MKSPFLLAVAAAGIAATPQLAGASVSPTLASIEQFGKCAAARYDGAELLATQPGSEEEAEVLAEFARRSCTSAVSDAGLLRGAVAEQLFKADFGAVGSRPKRESFEIFTLEEGDLDLLDDSAKRRFDVVAFGTCVAASNPVQAAAVLGSEPGSGTEAVAVAALEPAFSPCLQQGEQLSVAKSQLRGALAEGVYRVAVSFALNREIVVTGSKDASRKVTCKVRQTAGTYFGQKTCLTSEQWAARARDEEIAARDFARRAEEEQERLQTAMAVALRAASAGQ